MRQRNGKNEENLTFDLKLARVLKPAHKINKQIGPRMRASILQAVQACFKYAMQKSNLSVSFRSEVRKEKYSD